MFQCPLKSHSQPSARVWNVGVPASISVTAYLSSMSAWKIASPALAEFTPQGQPA